MTTMDLLDELDAAGRAYDAAQARLYEATKLSDVRRVVRHEGVAWAVVERQLYLREHDGEWRWFSDMDGGGDVVVRACDALTIVYEYDDEQGGTAHVVTTALRDDAGAREVVG